MRNHFPLLFAGAALLLMTSGARGQDATVVDPDHYIVEFENDQVRVLRISYGPHEKSVMHEHLASIAVMLTDNQIWKMTNEEGETEELEAAFGQAIWAEAGAHLPENLTDSRQEVILVEVKSAHKESH
jgi:hypothetical protein